MTVVSFVESPFPLFNDRAGDALEGGYLYIGLENLNPETVANRVDVYWDPLLHVRAEQPVRTLGGYPSFNGSPGKLYTGSGNFSITVLDKHRALVYSSASSASIYVAIEVDTLSELLANRGTLEGQRASVLGYQVKGDGGGGNFYWDSTSVSVPDFRNVFEAAGGGVGRWVRMSATNETYNVEDITGLMALSGDVANSKRYILVSGFYTADDGGGGYFRYDPTGAKSTHNGGTIIDPDIGVTPGAAGWWTATGVTTGVWERVSTGNSIVVEIFGAKTSPTYDSGPAMRAALNYVIASPIHEVLELRGGAYLVGGDGVTTDGYQTGLLLYDVDSYTHGYTGVGAVTVKGVGKQTSLVCADNEMVMIRISANNCCVKDLTVFGLGNPDVIGLGIMPRDKTQITTLTNNSYNSCSNMIINGFSEGIYLQAGPDVGGGDSGCWYNQFQHITIANCVRGIWLNSPPNNSSPCNRNRFIDVHVGQGVCNTGVYITAGDTNAFIGLTLEGILSGTSPLATPTGIYILAADPVSGFDNNHNYFIGGAAESVTRPVYNDNGLSGFVGFTYDWGSSAFPALPTLSIGGNGPSQVPQIAAGLIFQTNSQIAGYDNAVNSLWDFCEPGLRWQPYPITLSNTTNLISVSKYESSFTVFAGFVEWYLRFNFRCNVSTTPVTIEIPHPANVNQHLTVSTIPVDIYPVILYNGIAVEYSHATFSVAGISPTTLSFLHTGNWNTGGNNNDIWLTMRYRKE